VRALRVLDLFCKAGGAGYGYWLAGQDSQARGGPAVAVTGVDSEPQPRYPFGFREADALTFPLDGFDLIHASPPCQAHSDLRNAWNARPRGDLIPAVRERLEASGLPWVIENVPGAPLKNPVTLCGCMFGLGTPEYRLERKRLFETSFPLGQPACACASDPRPVVGVYGGKIRNRRAIATGSQRSRVGTTLPLETGQQAMGITWMTRGELSQAVPPAYTRFIGRSLIDARTPG
jgi:DNA (cytosine-5)-methyltransferase 1